MRLTDTGEIESGVLKPAEPENLPGAAGLVEFEGALEPGICRVKSFTPFTARGPCQVTSRAYRSGWDATFGGGRSRSKSN